MTNDSAVVGGGQANFSQTDVAVSSALRRPAVGTDFETKTELKSKKQQLYCDFDTDLSQMPGQICAKLNLLLPNSFFHHQLPEKSCYHLDFSFNVF